MKLEKLIWYILLYLQLIKKIQGPFNRISISPNGELIAFYTVRGHVWIVSRDLQDRIADFNAGQMNPPISFNWCGNDAIVAYWDECIFVIGPYGELLEYFKRLIIY